MRYISYLMSNSDIQKYINNIGDDCDNFLKENMSLFVYHNFKYIIENINDFLGNNLKETYKNIREFITADMLSLMNAISEAYAFDENFEYINTIMENDVDDVFTGIGYGTQKAEQIISSIYEEIDEEL